MNELIKVTTNAQGARLVNARDLHNFLESKRDFTTWIKDRIKKYNFIENEEYTLLTVPVEQVTGTKYLAEYILTLDTAKEIAMVEGNSKGKQARQYFIDKEKQLNGLVKPTSQIDALVQSVLILKEQEQRLTNVEQDVLLLKAQNTTRPDYLTVVGYAVLNGIKIGLVVAARIGAKAKALCKSKGITVESIPDPRFGRVGMYPAFVLEQVFNSIQF